MTNSAQELPPPNVPVWTLGDRMRKALRHADMSVAEMADELGVSLATMGRWLNDRGPVKRHVLKMWALTCGVPLEWLERGELPRLDSNQQPFGYPSPQASGAEVISLAERRRVA